MMFQYSAYKTAMLIVSYLADQKSPPGWALIALVAFNANNYIISMAMAVASPPPIHKDAKPLLKPLFLSA